MWKVATLCKTRNKSWHHHRTYGSGPTKEVVVVSRKLVIAREAESWRGDKTATHTRTHLLADESHRGALVQEPQLAWDRKGKRGAWSLETDTHMTEL